jgi:hypothetical protein
MAFHRSVYHALSIQWAETDLIQRDSWFFWCAAGVFNAHRIDHGRGSILASQNKCGFPGKGGTNSIFTLFSSMERLSREKVTSFIREEVWYDLFSTVK